MPSNACSGVAERTPDAHAEGEFDIRGSSEDRSAVEAVVMVDREALVAGEGVPNLYRRASAADYRRLRSQPTRTCFAISNCSMRGTRQLFPTVETLVAMIPSGLFGVPL